MNRIGLSVLRLIFFLFVLVSDMGLEGSLTSVRTLLVGLICLSVLPFAYIYRKYFIKTCFRTPLFYFCIFILLGFVSTLFSEIPIKSFTYIFGYTTLTFFAISLVKMFELKTLISIIKAAIFLGVFLSVLGQFLGIIDGYTYELGWGSTRRFGGLYGQPNPMGAASALYIIIFLDSFPKNFLVLPSLKNKSVITVLYGFYSSILFVMTFFMSLWALWQSNSRSALLGLIVSLTALFFMQTVKTLNKWGAFGRVLLLALILFILLTSSFLSQKLSEDNLNGLSRSGDASELTTLTGRTVLWSYLLEKIAEKPLLGYGMGSVETVSANLGYEWATHAHNAYIEAAVYTGYLGGAIFILFMISSLTQAVFSLLKDDESVKLIFAFALFYGILAFFEPVILGSARNSLLLILITSAYLSLRKEEKMNTVKTLINR